MTYKSIFELVAILSKQGTFHKGDVKRITYKAEVKSQSFLNKAHSIKKVLQNITRKMQQVRRNPF